MIAPGHLLLDWENHRVVPLPGDIGHWPEPDCYCHPEEQTLEITAGLSDRPFATVTHWVHTR